MKALNGQVKQYTKSGEAPSRSAALGECAVGITFCTTVSGWWNKVIPTFIFPFRKTAPATRWVPLPWSKALRRLKLPRYSSTGVWLPHASKSVRNTPTPITFWPIPMRILPMKLLHYAIPNSSNMILSGRVKTRTAYLKHGTTQLSQSRTRRLLNHCA